MSSQAQIAANQQNAQLSTGPTSAAGKTKVALNAVKTGLTGRTVLLPSDDAAEYQSFVAAYEKELAPAGRLESDLVQSIADIQWRLGRIPGLEMALYAKGRLELAASFAEHDPAVRAVMIELQTLLVYEKQFKNLHLQEARLHRRYEKMIAELRQLKQERAEQRKQQLQTAARLYAAARKEGKSFDLAANGFEFSASEVESYIERFHRSTSENVSRGSLPKAA